MAKKSFVIYENWAILLQGLPDKEAGELIKAICSFQLGKEPAIESQTVKAMYSMIRPKMEEDVASYEETVKKRSEAGKAGAKKRWNDDSKTWQSIANDSKCYSDDSKTWQSIADTDTDNDTDTVNNNILRESVKEKRQHFTPPTREEIAEYCRVQELTVDADRFVDYYTSNDWMVGKNKMKDWKAACRNWSRSQKKETAAKAKTNAFHNFAQRKDDLEALESQLDQQFAKGIAAD